MDRRACLVGLVLGAFATAAQAEVWGHFVGNFDVRFNDDGRKMTLLAPYEYDDPAQRAWPVTKGWVVDGASIPQPFWSIVGGPLEGKYRNASAIHDYYCDKRTRTWQDVHRMFYAAMRAKGVNAIQAKIMFAAVWFKGPRWQLTASLCTSEQAEKLLGLIQQSATTPGAKALVDGLVAEFGRSCPSQHTTTITLADVEQMKWLAAKIRATNPPIDQVERLVRVADIRARELEEKNPRLRERAVVERPVIGD